MADRPTVALLGTGIMGAAMGRRILAAGLPLRVWNRTPEKARPLADAGAEPADDPADAVRGADVIVTMLGDAGHVRDVMDAGRPTGCAPGRCGRRRRRSGSRRWPGSSSWPTGTGCCSSTRRCSAPARPPSRASSWCWPPGRRRQRDVVEPVFDAIGRATVWLADDAGGRGREPAEAGDEQLGARASPRVPPRRWRWPTGSVSTRGVPRRGRAAARWTCRTCR